MLSHYVSVAPRRPRRRREPPAALGAPPPHRPRPHRPRPTSSLLQERQAEWIARDYGHAGAVPAAVLLDYLRAELAATAEAADTAPGPPPPPPFAAAHAHVTLAPPPHDAVAMDDDPLALKPPRPSPGGRRGGGGGGSGVSSERGVEGSVPKPPVSDRPSLFVAWGEEREEGLPRSLDSSLSVAATLPP